MLVVGEELGRLDGFAIVGLGLVGSGLGDSVGLNVVGLADGTFDFSIVGIFDGKQEGLIVGVLVVGSGFGATVGLRVGVLVGLDVVGEELGRLDGFAVVGLRLVGSGLGDSVGLNVVGALDGLEVVG